MLYRGECSDESLTTACGMVIFSAASYFHGREELGYEALGTVRTMAHRLSLFGVAPDSPVVSTLQERPPEWTKAASQIAWGAYTWISWVQVANNGQCC